MKFISQVKNYILTGIYGKKGLPRIVNGETYRCIPNYRWYFSKEYDNPVANYFKQKIRPGDHCVSIGSNMGIYPLQFARWIGKTGIVHAFEPNPETSKVLKKHVELNDFSDQIIVYQKAISDEEGYSVFHASETDGMSRLGEENQLLMGKTKAIQVEVVTIDDQFINSRINALMMDIEGFEIAALKGAQQFLKTELPNAMVIEMHPNAWNVANTSKEDLLKILTDNDLKVISLSGQNDPLSEYGHIALERN